MPRPLSKPEWQRAVITLAGVIVACLVFGLLYWARAIFIPLALAIFFTFVLAPLVHILERRGLGRSISVVLVVGIVLVGLSGTLWLIVRQVADLTATLPDNAERIKAKVASVHEWVFGDGNSRLGQLVNDLQSMMTPPPLNDEAVQPLVVATQKHTWQDRIAAAINPAIEIVGQIAFAFILVVFMLLKKEDLRNRLLRLVGDVRVTTATKAIDDTTRRISRYLLMQLVVNVTFGLLVTLGLMVIQVPYAPMWGLVAAFMRYVPYIGTWIGLVPPTIFSLAVSNGWWQPLTVVGLFLGLEAIGNNFVEPRVYGSRLGVSEVALLVAAAFWSFLWGPVGLILSGPLTTCLYMLGKYIPRFEFLAILLGNEPPLAPGVALYQRLAAKDQDEAASVVFAAAKEGDAAATFDGTVIPALILTNTAVANGELDESDLKVILVAVREIVAEVGDLIVERADRQPARADIKRVRLLTCPARDEIDELPLEMLTQLLGPEQWDMAVSGSHTLAGELLAKVSEFQPDLVCIGALPPGGQAHTRYLCKRLRGQFPQLNIVVGRWGLTDDPDVIRKELIEAGADHVEFSVSDTAQHILGWEPVFASQETRPGTSGQEKTAPSFSAIGTVSA